MQNEEKAHCFNATRSKTIWMHGSKVGILINGMRQICSNFGPQYVASFVVFSLFLDCFTFSWLNFWFLLMLLQLLLLLFSASLSVYNLRALIDETAQDPCFKETIRYPSPVMWTASVQMKLMAHWHHIGTMGPIANMRHQMRWCVHLISLQI